MYLLSFLLVGVIINQSSHEDICVWLYSLQVQVYQVFSVISNKLTSLLCLHGRWSFIYCYLAHRLRELLLGMMVGKHTYLGQKRGSFQEKKDNLMVLRQYLCYIFSSSCKVWCVPGFIPMLMSVVIVRLLNICVHVHYKDRGLVYLGNLNYVVEHRKRSFRLVNYFLIMGTLKFLLMLCCTNFLVYQGLGSALVL